VQMSLIMFGPESPRWLMSKGRDREALDILTYYYGKGNPHDPMVLYTFEEMKNAIETEKAQGRTNWIALFNSKGMRRRSFTMMGLALAGQWSGNGLVTYYLSPVLNTIGLTDRVQQLAINLSLSVWNFICGYVSGFQAERFGRKAIMLTMTILMFFFLVAVTICSARYNITHSNVAGDFVVLFIFLFTGCYQFGWPSIMLLYCTEIVPFSMRSKGHSLWAITQASFLVFNQYTNPIGFSSLGWKYYIVFDCVMVLIIVCLYLFIIETKGLTLEETAVLFDGVDAVQELQKTADINAAADARMDDIIAGHIDEGSKSPASEKGSISHQETV